ncbi:hypothetical protein ABZ635_16925 [Nocardiopsis sp. NPDC007018]|uniref:hypothetical protein n=1 Tax=Nocardiopsis sp. NPDC007018 TaxID=3155721 RepID=UPI0033E9CEC2
MKDIVDYGPQSIQHAQNQLLRVMLDRDLIDIETLQESGLLRSEFDGEKEEAAIEVIRHMGDRNATGNYATLENLQEDVGLELGEPGKNPVNDYFNGVRNYYAPGARTNG